MFCMNCGKQMPDMASFCPFCGHGINDLSNNQPVKPMRTIYFRRPFSLIGAAVSFEIYFDDESVAYIDNGGTFALEGVDSEPHTAFVVGAGIPQRKLNSFKNSAITIPVGTKNLTYEISPTFKAIQILKLVN